MPNTLSYRCLASLSLTVFLLLGCGQKGALYLEDNPQKTKAISPDKTTTTTPNQQENQ